MAQKKPDYVEQIVMVALGTPLYISIPDLQTSLVQDEEMRLSTWLLKAEATYCRNQKMEDDALYVELKSGVTLIFHAKHMCVHKDHNKIGHFHFPLYINCAEAAALISEHQIHE